MDNNYRAAQRAYDRQEPPEHTLSEEGECEHEWRVTKSIEVVGETLRAYKCVNCGATDHD